MRSTVAVVCLLLAAGCASSDQAGETDSSESAVNGSSAGDELEVVLERGIVYYVDGEEELAMDVAHPDGGGPWPLVVVYHGRPAGPSIAEARTIAARGAVAFAPRWVNDWSAVDRDDYIDGALFDRAACAVGKAQEVAEDYDADPANTIVSGFSAGMHPAGWVGLGAMRDDMCEVPIAYSPVGLVMGDSQFVFFEEGWDASLADPASRGADSIDRFVNPGRWSPAADLEVYLWTSGMRYGRVIENPPAPDAWIWSRDTTGTLVDDLAAIGAFDDEWVGWMDNALLMEERMKSAGIEVVHEAVGGGHAYSEPVFDAIIRIGTGSG